MPIEPLTLTEAAERYLEHLSLIGKNKRTLYTYGRDLEQIKAFFGPEKPVQGLTLPLIGRFLKSDELLRLSNGRDRAPQTVRKTIRVLRMFLVWCKWQVNFDPLRRSYFDPPVNGGQRVYHFKTSS